MRSNALFCAPVIGADSRKILGNHETHERHEKSEVILPFVCLACFVVPNPILSSEIRANLRHSRALLNRSG